MKSFLNTEKICKIKDPLHWSEEKNKIMLDGIREMLLFHQENCPEIANMYKRYKFDPNQIKSIDDFSKIPPLGVSAMKSYLILSRPPEKATLKLTSSGTGGQKTQIWFDEESLQRVQSMLDVIFEQEGMLSNELTNYVVFTYDPAEAKNLGIAYTEKNQLRFAPVKQVHYAIKKDHKGEWFFDKDKVKEVLRAYEKENLPVRILGMPGFIFDFINTLPKDERFLFDQRGLMITGGGWKAAEDKQITRQQLRELCSRTFGFPLERIRDAYGMAEHSAPYFECSHHRFHIPVYNRLIIRDAETFKPLPNGEKGLLELITPFNSMMPTTALLTTDWAMIDKDVCPCGQKSPTFTLLGRSGLSKHKGCAISADEIMKRGKRS